MKRVKVDFSTTVNGGMIRASQKRASETLHVGDEVEAFDPAEDMEFVGVVDHLSDDGRFAFLRMQWEDNTPATPYNVAGHNLFVASLSGATITAEPLYAVSSEASADQFVSPPIQVPLPAANVTAPHLTPA